MKRLRNAWKHRPVLTSAFAVAVLLTVLFAVRSTVFMVYWSNPDHIDQEIRSWMTPRYIALSWHLPPEVMSQALGTEKMPGRRQSIADIAREQGISVQALVANIIATATTYRDSQR
ncbi:MAG: hypothetical protein V3V25_13495 [Paracoccaceae bacterium]